LDIAGKGVIVCRALTRLRQNAIYLTHLGGRFRDFFLNQAKLEQIKIEAIPCQTEIRFCTTIIERNPPQVHEIVEDGFTVNKRIEQRVRKGFMRLLPKVNYVIITGSKAKGYSQSLFPDFLKQARRMNKPVLTDIRGNDLKAILPQKPSLIKLNVEEFVFTFFSQKELNSLNEDPINQISKKLNELYQRYKIDIIITNGPHPFWLLADGKLMLKRPVAIQDPLNTTGCGDVFLAGLGLGLAHDFTLEGACELAADLSAENARGYRPGFIKKRSFVY